MLGQAGGIDRADRTRKSSLGIRHGTATDCSGSTRSWRAGGKGNYHAGVLSAFGERAHERVQPEVESRVGDDAGRGGSAPGASLDVGTGAGAIGGRRFSGA